MDGAVDLPLRTPPARTRANVHPRPRNVLFLCADNSASSIIAEALLSRWGAESFRAFSAGIKPGAQVHPLADSTLKSQGIWNPNLQPKHVCRFSDGNSPEMDFIISLGSEPPNGLPGKWPGTPRVLHWRITEPYVDGKPEQKIRAFRRTFTELETRIKLFVLVNEKEAWKRIAA